MKIGRYTIKADRWPWQGYGWRKGGGKSAPLNGGNARFGGGWHWKLGISIGGSTIIIDLLFGSIRISRLRRLKCETCGEKVGDFHATGCGKRMAPRHGFPADSWLNKVNGY